MEEQAKAVEKAKPKTTALQATSAFLRSESVMRRFAEIVGQGNVGAYVNSVLLAVASNTTLQECTSHSIFVSAMRAATLRMSVDPSTGQAYLVPFKGKAVLIVGYKGLYDMAVRTGRYRFINVTPRFEGQGVEPDPISGLITYESLTGHATSDKIVGWLGAFEMNPERNQRTGFAHTIYMTVEEIHKHAKHYSRSYDDPAGSWKKETAAMERKTVLRILLRRWGYLDPADIQALESIEAEPEAIDAEFTGSVDLDLVPKIEKSEDEIMQDLGYKSKKKKADQPAPEPATTKETLTPINKEIERWKKLAHDVEELGYKVTPLPDKVTIDQVRKINEGLERTAKEANNTGNDPWEPPFPPEAGKP